MAGRIWTQMSDPALNELIFLEEAEAKGTDWRSPTGAFGGPWYLPLLPVPARSPTS